MFKEFQASHDKTRGQKFNFRDGQLNLGFLICYYLSTHQKSEIKDGGHQTPALLLVAKLLGALCVLTCSLTGLANQLTSGRHCLELYTSKLDIALIDRALACLEIIFMFVSVCATYLIFSVVNILTSMY